MLEEYREVILPMRGRARGQLWYLRQIVSLMTSVQFGAALGLAFSAAVALFNVALPVKHLTVPEVPYLNAIALGGAFVLFGAAGFRADRRVE